jgi:putative membrane protein
MTNYGPLPPLIAGFNGLSAALLLVGRYQIARHRVSAHRACMLSAFAASSIFLVCYLSYHFWWLPTHLHINSVHFVGPHRVRTAYLWLLGTHTILATVSVPLILAALYYALKGKFDSHRRVVQWTFPIWLYVGVTGVVVYLLLYQVYPT